jgi:pyridoxine 5-phosphate synthase
MKLGVNVDHVATLRQARHSKLISPVDAARICEEAGADSIVAHLREDRRHIQDKDVILLRDSVKGHLNLEMSIAKDIVAIACRVKPDVSTLVPEHRRELTTEGGLDVVACARKVERVIKKLKLNRIIVSLFIDPIKRQIQAAYDLGADTVELHTGVYAESKNIRQEKYFLSQLKDAACLAQGLGLHVAAGHGLDYENAALVARIKEIEELNIGYSIICRAMFVGLDKAIKEMRSLIDRENIYTF